NIEIDVTAAQLSQLSCQNAPGTDTVQVRASDGTMWSSWASFTVTGPVVKVVAASGSVNLTEVGTAFYLYDSNGSGPSLKFGGMDFAAGQFGPWTPIGAEATASGYEVAWKYGSANQYTVSITNSSGNYLSNAIGVVSGSDYALESLEPSFQLDLNRDGVIGPPKTVISDNGTTSLTQAGTIGAHFFLYADNTGTGPSLKFGGMAFAAGQFGPWTPIGAQATASGYEVAWKYGSADQYSLSVALRSCNYLSNAIGVVSGSDYALESLEPSFHQDL